MATREDEGERKIWEDRLPYKILVATESKISSTRKSLLRHAQGVLRKAGASPEVGANPATPQFRI